ncbi:DUF4166 domain-containing protein [Dyella koreensis]|uniref:DUF4166 domain-containing protein n=1 Tax=Dyella koreensis TaxID=311235 RepID=A0ABW8K4B1_9GAMM
MRPHALFPALIGAADWRHLAPAVRRMHGDTPSLHAKGVAKVEGANHWPARILRRVLGLPEPGEDQPLALTIERDGPSEIWTRHFKHGRMRSTLERTADGTNLREQLGPMALYFTLRRDGEAIDWQLQQGRLLGLPVPRALLGKVLSRSTAGQGRYVFHIDARLPLLGQLIAYRGWLEITDEHH